MLCCVSLVPLALLPPREVLVPQPNLRTSLTPRPLVEQALMQLLRETARQRGSLVHLGGEGDAFPDVVLAHPRHPRPLWVLTLLATLSQPTPAQQAWLEALAHSTVVEALVVRPGDYRELIERLGTRR